MMNSIMPDTQAGGDFQLLSVLTNPLVDRIVQLDPAVIECWSNPVCNSSLLNASLIREYCSSINTTIDLTQTRTDPLGRMISPIARGSNLVQNPTKCRSHTIILLSYYIWIYVNEFWYFKAILYSPVHHWAMQPLELLYWSAHLLFYADVWCLLWRF